MTVNVIIARRFALAVAIAALAACDNAGNNQPTGVTIQPLPTTTPVAGTATFGPDGTVLSPVPSDGASVAPVASATPAGVFFRDDFDGTAIDAAKWDSFEQSGLILMREGGAEMLTSGLTKDFPLLISHDEVIPKTGAFYAEIKYTIVQASNVIIPAFCFDNLPPSKPGETGLTDPFLYTQAYRGGFSVVTRPAGSALRGIPGPAKPLQAGSHRFRLEWNDSNDYRAIIDDLELDAFQSTRPRPTRLWIGPYPNKALATAVAWPRFRLDSVETGLLAAPDPATPAATATPKPTATP